MTLEEYIEKNYSEDQLNEYSMYSGWHEAILEIVRETWQAAQLHVNSDQPIGSDCPHGYAKRFDCPDCNPR